ncbi:hypothetical protein J6590_029900 [Homalodisca vitripennis]|nr:hypothetical protein J6590_029900 [Homalodisca vitripennis]
MESEAGATAEQSSEYDGSSSMACCPTSTSTDLDAPVTGLTLPVPVRHSYVTHRPTGHSAFRALYLR